MGLTKRLSLSLALVVSGAAITPIGALAKPQYGYSGNVAPEKWGQLSSEYRTCTDGSEQAPVNIVSKSTVKKTTATALQPDYVATTGTVVNTGTTIQVNTSGNLKIGTTPYKLLQYHFHTPSEEAINGVHYDANVHLVHQDAKGRLAGCDWGELQKRCSQSLSRFILEETSRQERRQRQRESSLPEGAATCLTGVLRLRRFPHHAPLY